MGLMTKVYGKFIIPLSYYIKGDMRFMYFNHYKKNLNQSKDDIMRLQLERLQQLVYHAYDTVPYYRELFDNIGLKPGDIRTIEDFKKIPELEKKTVLDNCEKLKSSKKYKLINHFSGGSTGNKALIYKDKQYHEMSYGAMMSGLYSAGIEPGCKSAWIWGDTHHNESWLKRFIDFTSKKINRRIMFNVFKYTDKEMEDWLTNEFSKFKPDYIYGYAGVIYSMARLIKGKNIKIPPLKKIITTSERLENREFIESVFNCPVIDQYGCSEVTIVAIEDDNYVMHSSDDFVIAEINDNNEILLTPLESYGMPLLRYKVGDVGLIEKNNHKSYDASPFSQFNIVIGRIYEMLFDKDNKKISGGLIKQEAEDEDLVIHEFQVVQKTLDDIDLNIVKDKYTTKAGAERLGEIIKEILGCSAVNINYMDRYPVEKNGKKIAFKCLINKN